MLQVTGTEQLRAWERCVLPPVEQVRPGLWSIPVPIPDNPLRYVLVYVLDAGAVVALVDAGWNTDDAWAALVAGLEQIGAAISDVAAVLVTHMHPDHYGLAGRVRERSGAWIGLHPADADLLQARYLEPDDLLARMRVLMEDAGVPAERLPDLQMTSMVLRAHVAMAEPDVLFADGEPVAVPGWDLQALWTPGHSPGHVCFYSEQHRLLLSGDHILPRISPNIAVHTQQFPDPLGDYLASLRKCQPLVVDEVLPAHEYRFAGLSDRVEELVRHHLERLAEIESLLSDHPGASAWDLSVRLRWSRPWEEIEPFMQRAEWARRWPIWCCSNDTGGSPARARPRSASGASATGRTAPADLRRIQARGGDTPPGPALRPGAWRTAPGGAQQLQGRHEALSQVRCPHAGQVMRCVKPRPGRTSGTGRDRSSDSTTSTRHSAPQAPQRSCTRPKTMRRAGRRAGRRAAPASSASAGSAVENRARLPWSFGRRPSRPEPTSG